MAERLFLLSTFSILIPFLLTCYYFKKMYIQHLALATLILLGFARETLCVLTIPHPDYPILWELFKIDYNPNPLANVHILLEASTIFWLFKKWNAFNSIKWLFHFIQLLLVLTWCVELKYFRSMEKDSVSFTIIYSSFVIVLLSIHTINSLITQGHHHLLKNPIFICCTGFIFFFTISIIVELFMLNELGFTKAFSNQIFNFLGVTNFFTNLIYAYGIYRMTKTQRLATYFPGRAYNSN